jgi:hypothetical protein
VDPLFAAPLNFEPNYQNYYSNLSEENGFAEEEDDDFDDNG